MNQWYLFMRGDVQTRKEFPTRERAMLFARSLSCGEPVEVWIVDCVVVPQVEYVNQEYWKHLQREGAK